MIFFSFYLISFIIFFFIIRSFYKKIFLLFLFSSFSFSFFLDKTFFEDNILSITFFFIIHCIVFSIILPDSRIYKIRNLCIHPIINIIMKLSFLNVFTLFYIVIFMYSQLTIIDVTIGEFKNNKIASEILSESILKYFLFFSRILSPFGYFALFIMILKLINNELKDFYYYLFISLNIPLVHLVAFSRSFVVLYLLFLFFVFLKYNKSFNDHINVFLYKRISYVLSISLLVFFWITYIRFDGMTYWGKFRDSSFDNVLIFSLVYYLSSWVKISIVVLNEFPVALIGVYHDFLNLPAFLLSKIGFILHPEPFDYKNYSSEFKGLFVSLLYDQGILFLLLFITFIIMFRILIFYQHNIKLELSYSIFCIFLSISFFFGSLFVYIDYVLAFLYFFIFQKFVTVK